MTDPEIYETYKELAKLRAEEHRQNRAKAPDFLARHDLCFESFNYGAHLFVWAFGQKENGIDFWPGPKKFTIRSSGKRGRGLKNLLIHLKGEDYVNSLRNSTK